jgi:polysaccharide export outer membrane protein
LLTLSICLTAIGCGNKGAQSQQPSAGPLGAPQQQQGGTSAAAAQGAAPANSSKPGRNAELNKWLNEVDAAVPPTTYRVQPPDEIQISAPSVKELDKVSATIRPDGKIVLNLVGDVYVAGMSPSEIAEELTRRLSQFYNKETLYVAVDVTEFASKKYYVFGQVNDPGVKPYTGRDTVIKVLAEAGLNEDAWPQKVVLVRPSEDKNVRQKVTIDLKAMSTTGKNDQNYLLEEGDLLYVPPSPLAEFRMKTERILAPITPMTDIAFMAMGGF